MTLTELLGKADTFSDKQKEITMGFISAAMTEAGFEFRIDDEEGVIINQVVDIDLHTAWINDDGDVMVSILPGAGSEKKPAREFIDYADFQKLLAELLN